MIKTNCYGIQLGGTINPCKEGDKMKNVTINSAILSNKYWVILPVAFLLFTAHTVFAKLVIFEREYTYEASEADSKLSCRVIALEQVKRLLLEEL